MRILHVVRPPRGGAPAMVEMLARVQAREHEVGVVCRPRVARDLTGSGAAVWALPMVREISPLEDARDLGRLTRIVRRFDPDVVHAPQLQGGGAGAARREARGRARRLLSADPALRRRMGAARRERAQERFRIERMSAELEVVYRAAAQWDSISAESSALS